MIRPSPGRVARPAGTWPGVPLGSQVVLVPVAQDGELWGTREHGRLFVQARRLHEPLADLPGIRYQQMSVAELCRRLPTGATAGIGRMSRWLDCSHGALTQLPVEVDLSGFDKHSRVEPADAADWGLPKPVPGLDDPRLYEVLDMRRALKASLVVVKHADPATVETFLRACSEHRVAVPLQLWEAGRLPGWLRRAVEHSGEDGT